MEHLLLTHRKRSVVLPPLAMVASATSLIFKQHELNQDLASRGNTKYQAEHSFDVGAPERLNQQTNAPRQTSLSAKHESHEKQPRQGVP